MRRPARKETDLGCLALSVSFPPISRHRNAMHRPKRANSPRARARRSQGPVAHPASPCHLNSVRGYPSTGYGDPEPQPPVGLDGSFLLCKRDQRRDLLAGASRCPAPAMFSCSKPYPVASLPANLYTACSSTKPTSLSTICTQLGKLILWYKKECLIQ